MLIINQDRLGQLSQSAAKSARGRTNLNLHEEYADPCQRLFNAIEPGTYIRPHRHIDPPRFECFLPIRGRMALVVFSDQGNIDQVYPLGADSDIMAVELPPGVWHCLIALEPGTIFFELKPGPYLPLSDKDFAPWAPQEGSPGSADYLTELMEKTISKCWC
jgi:cupin fold WbuC family metalloprotein